MAMKQAQQGMRVSARPPPPPLTIDSASGLINPPPPPPLPRVPLQSSQLSFKVGNFPYMYDYEGFLMDNIAI